MKLSQITLEEALAWAPEKKWKFVCDGVKDDGETAEVALLLGTRHERSVERAVAAAELYLSGRVGKVVASGGVEWEYNGEMLSEAEFMKRIMVGQGVPEEDILLDNEARTTIENMICGTLVMARDKKLIFANKVIIVTSQAHMKRSLALAKALLPRKLAISSYPALQKEPMEEWIKSEKNLKALDNAIINLKVLVDKNAVQDVEI